MELLERAFGSPPSPEPPRLSEKGPPRLSEQGTSSESVAEYYCDAADVEFLERARVFIEPSFSALAASIGQGRRKNAPVRLIRAEYLLDQWAERKVLLRRQEIPEDAFYDGPLDPGRQWIVCVSYSWLSAHHPDPDSFHLRWLANLLLAHRQRYTGFEVLVFIDFCSLYQHERTPEQQSLFVQGLKSINLLYAHQTTCIWCLTRVPPSVPVGYHSRGWTTFEQTVGTAIKKVRHGACPAEAPPAARSQPPATLPLLAEPLPSRLWDAQVRARGDHGLGGAGGGCAR